VRTERSQGTTLKLVGAGEGESGSAYANSGLERAGSTTSHRIQIHQLSALLNDLERDLQELNSRYCEAYVTLLTAMEHLVNLGHFISATTTTEEDKC